MDAGLIPVAEKLARNLPPHTPRAEARCRAFEEREDKIRRARAWELFEIRAEACARARERRREASRRNIKAAHASRRGQRDAVPPEPIKATFWLSGAKGLVRVGGSHPKPDHQS